jgi:FG-GAP-like repeat
MVAVSWKSPVNGNWNVAANWSTNAVPALTDDVTISAAGSYTVTISSNGVIVHPFGGLLAAIQLGGPDEAESLNFNAPQATLQENAGALDVEEALAVSSGSVLLNEANTIGSVIVTGGVLAFGNGAALGTGTVTESGGELLATANETLTNGLDFSGTSTIAAAHGTTLNEDSSFYGIGANSTLNFGALGDDGTILWHTNGGSSISVPNPAIDVQAGTLKGADSLFPFLLNNARQVTVAAGATLDVAGNNASIVSLLGGGAVIDSGGAATLTLDSADFSGTISGALKLSFDGDAFLSGLVDYTGGATLEGAITVTNQGTYDLVANTNITGSAGSFFVNNHIFEKTDGVGVSLVTSNFVNSGVLNVLSGSVQFTGGFTNHGLIRGRVTRSGGVTTVTALVPSDFNEDGVSDILWQNTTSGQGSVWDMNGNTVTSGGPVDPNPGTSWTEIGTGDFNGDGHADILWQNVDGQASIWDMNGNTPIGGGPVSPNPGSSWKAIGTGDFNGDGLSDILWQNTGTGQASIWEMNGNSLIGGGPVSPNPGSSWKAIGTGDFNGDGHSDILFQNTSSGQVSIWEMNGNTLIGGGPVSPNPGTSWKAIGTGDFNNDGRSDILFQNTTSGQVSIWEMSGNTLIGGGPVSPNPGPSWHAVGTGDFNGAGHSDILFQNTSGQATVWEMNGSTLIGGGPVSPNPGPSWRAVA